MRLHAKYISMGCAYTTKYTWYTAYIFCSFIEYYDVYSNEQRRIEWTTTYRIDTENEQYLHDNNLNVYYYILLFIEKKNSPRRLSLHIWYCVALFSALVRRCFLLHDTRQKKNYILITNNNGKNQSICLTARQQQRRKKNVEERYPRKQINFILAWLERYNIVCVSASLPVSLWLLMPTFFYHSI